MEKMLNDLTWTLFLSPVLLYVLRRLSGYTKKKWKYRFAIFLGVVVSSFLIFIGAVLLIDSDIMSYWYAFDGKGALNNFHYFRVSMIMLAMYVVLFQHQRFMFMCIMRIPKIGYVVDSFYRVFEQKVIGSLAIGLFCAFSVSARDYEVNFWFTFYFWSILPLFLLHYLPMYLGFILEIKHRKEIPERMRDYQNVCGGMRYDAEKGKLH